MNKLELIRDDLRGAADAIDKIIKGSDSENTDAYLGDFFVKMMRVKSVFSDIADSKK